MDAAPGFPEPGAAGDGVALPPLIDPALAATIRRRWADGDRVGATILVTDAMAAMAQLLRALSQGETTDRIRAERTERPGGPAATGDGAQP